MIIAEQPIRTIDGVGRWCHTDGHSSDPFWATAMIYYRSIGPYRRFPESSNNLRTRGHITDDISVWCERNCSGAYSVENSEMTVYFREHGDAVLFMLAFA